MGCFLSGQDNHLGKDFKRFLKRQARVNARSVFDTARPQVQTRLLAVKPAMLRANVPDGMAEIPPATAKVKTKDDTWMIFFNMRLLLIGDRVIAGRMNVGAHAKVASQVIASIA